MTKIKLLSIAVIGLLLINIGILAFLFLRKHVPPPDRPMRGREGPKNIIIERLHFDKEQVAQYEKLIEQHQQNLQQLDGQIRMTKNQLYSTLATDNIAGKDSLANKLGEIQRQIESVHYNHFTDIKKLCKPEQLENFNALTHDLAKFFAPGKNLPTPPRD
jgi:hypothetical protein